MSTSFGNLYTYVSDTGVVVPQTSDVKTTVQDAFKEIFGSDFNTSEETINGRLIEAISLLFIDVCGVNAQNISRLNIDRAIGSFLDGLGNLLGVSRSSGQSDSSYRKSILNAASRGSGFATSIANAIKGKANVTNVIVLDNGSEDPATLPIKTDGTSYSHSVLVQPHSVLISIVGDPTASDVIDAVKSTKSAGCGYTKSSDIGGTLNSKTSGGYAVSYYTPTEIAVTITVSVSGNSYNGSTLATDTTAAITSLISGNSICATTTKAEIMAAIAAYEQKGIVCTDVAITKDGEKVDELVIKPTEHVDTANTTNFVVTVNIV